MATAVARPQPVEIPNKLYFRIGDVVRLTGLKAYVLRYWETEFSSLSPKKSGTNQRLYRRKDVETILTIKDLLYEKRFTIEGARAHLSALRSAQRTPPPAPASQASLFPTEKVDLSGVRTELRAILDLLG